MKVLAIGDIHEPYTRRNYIDFCVDIYNAWDCDTVVFMGDVIDWQALSFFDKHPDAPGAKDEYLLAKEGLEKWVATFPDATVCLGNHDKRTVRCGAKQNAPSIVFKDYSVLWDTPNWDWRPKIVIDKVHYYHKSKGAGLHPAYNAAKKKMHSVCLGHSHSRGGVKWLVNEDKRWFGMDVGCGIDDDAIAFVYNEEAEEKSVISCGVVIDGHPYHEMMPLEEYK